MTPTIGAQPLKAGKPRRRWFAALVFGFAGIGLIGLAACRHEAPEQALRGTIARMQAAVEAHDVDALFEPIGEEFVGPEGMDRQAFRRYVTLVTLQNRNIGLQPGPLDVQLLGERATVNFTAAVSGGERWLPERGQVYRVETGWRLDDGQWELISAKWQPAL